MSISVQKQTNNKEATIFLISAFVVVIGLIVILAITSSRPNTLKMDQTDVVKMIDGKQVIEITVSGDYYPGVVNAKAGIPTILRMQSKNSYGCERAFRIASLNISKTLPANGTTDFEISAQNPGSKIVGACSMVMYSFVINFN